MGNSPSIPHLRDEAVGSKKDRRAAKINNHIRRMLWAWWKAAKDCRGVYVERKNGVHKLMKYTDHTKASKPRTVKRVLLFSNNGEDLNIFIDWVVDNAPKITVDEIMECRTPEEMIAFVWKKGGGLQQYKEKLWRLRSE